jgi:hypothetical protein
VELAGLSSIIDLRRAVPNLSQNHAGLRSFSDNYVMRGLGNTEFLRDAAVVLYGLRLRMRSAALLFAYSLGKAPV